MIMNNYALLSMDFVRDNPSTPGGIELEGAEII